MEPIPRSSELHTAHVKFLCFTVKLYIIQACTTYQYGIACSETSANKIQTPGNSPKERIQNKTYSVFFSPTRVPSMHALNPTILLLQPCIRRHPTKFSRLWQPGAWDLCDPQPMQCFLRARACLVEVVGPEEMLECFVTRCCPCRRRKERIKTTKHPISPIGVSALPNTIQINIDLSSI